MKEIIKKQIPLLLMVALLATYAEVAHGAVPLGKAIAKDEAAVREFCTQYPDFCAKPAQMSRILAAYPNIFEVVRTVTVTGGGGGGGPVLGVGEGVVNIPELMQRAIASGKVLDVAYWFNTLSNQKPTGAAFKLLQGFKSNILTSFGGTFAAGLNGLDQYSPPGAPIPGGLLPPPAPIPSGPVGPPPPPPLLGPGPVVVKTWESALIKLREDAGPTDKTSFEAIKRIFNTTLPQLPHQVELAIFSSWDKSKSILLLLVPIIKANATRHTDTANLIALINQYIIALTNAYTNRKNPNRAIFAFDQPVPNADSTQPATTVLQTKLIAWVKEFLTATTKNTPKHDVALEFQKRLNAFSSYLPTIIQTYDNSVDTLL